MTVKNNLEKITNVITESKNGFLNINELDKTDITSLDADIKTVSGVNIPYPFKVNEDNEEFVIPKDLTQIKNYIVYTKKDKDSKEYDEYINNVKKIQLYDTGIKATYGEQLMTLVTCEYSQKNGRFVVVAKRIR